MFETTATGYRATDEAVVFWRSRDTCPSCGVICEPTSTTDGVNEYRHDCDNVVWHREV